MVEISSSANSKLKQFRLLQKRKHRGNLSLVPLEGITLVEDVFMAGARFSWAVYSGDALSERGFNLLAKMGEAGVPLLEAPHKLLQGVSGVETFQGLICAAEMPLHTAKDMLSQEPVRLLVLDGLQDPGNLGTLFRTALAGGMTGVFCTLDTVDPFNPKALRASMGAVFRMPFLKDLEAKEAASLLKANGIKLFFCHPRGGISCFDLSFPPSHALIIGNESRGISPGFMENCGYQVSIPLVGPVESLNAATAGAVIIYEALRQNRGQA